MSASVYHKHNTVEDVPAVSSSLLSVAAQRHIIQLVEELIIQLIILFRHPSRVQPGAARWTAYASAGTTTGRLALSYLIVVSDTTNTDTSQP